MDSLKWKTHRHQNTESHQHIWKCNQSEESEERNDRRQKQKDDGSCDTPVRNERLTVCWWDTSSKTEWTHTQWLSSSHLWFRPQSQTPGPRCLSHPHYVYSKWLHAANKTAPVLFNAACSQCVSVSLWPLVAWDDCYWNSQCGGEVKCGVAWSSFT